MHLICDDNKITKQVQKCREMTNGIEKERGWRNKKSFDACVACTSDNKKYVFLFFMYYNSKLVFLHLFRSKFFNSIGTILKTTNCIVLHSPSDMQQTIKKMQQYFIVVQFLLCIILLF